MEEKSNNNQKMYEAADAVHSKLWFLSEAFKAMDQSEKQKVCEVTWGGLALICDEMNRQLWPVVEHLMNRKE